MRFDLSPIPGRTAPHAVPAAPRQVYLGCTIQHTVSDFEASIRRCKHVSPNGRIPCKSKQSIAITGYLRLFRKQQLQHSSGYGISAQREQGDSGERGVNAKSCSILQIQGTQLYSVAASRKRQA